MGMHRSLILIIALVLIPCVFAIRISPDSILIPFEPGFEKEYSFNTNKVPNTVVAIQGDLAKYFTIKENNIEKEGTFIVKASLPEQIETPGDNVIYISLMEGGKDVSMMGGIASIRTPIVVRVPYPGSYANIGFSVRNVNFNETGHFNIDISNMGDHNETASASIELLFGSSLIDQFYAQNTVIPMGTSGRISIPFAASKYPPGPYKAIADVSYGDKTQKLGADFFIGSLHLDIAGYSTSFLPHKINKVDIQAVSLWNSPLPSVFAEVAMINGSQILSQFKTPTLSMPALGKVLLQGYWDASSVGEGNYTMQITLEYDGKQTTQSTQITVAEGQLAQQSLFASVNWTIAGLGAIVVLLVLLNLIILFRRRS